MFKVVILGHGEMLANLIAGALDAKCNIVGVLRYERVQMSRPKRWIKDIFNLSTEFNYLKSYKIPEIKAKSANSEEFKSAILKLNPDIILMGTWGEKLKPETIKLAKVATINVHPSLLPKYRGPNPYLQTIWHGEKETGVTFHLVDENFDTGAILIQKKVEIKDNDTSKELKARTVLAARGAACELLETLSREIVMPIKQSEKQATYFPQITEDDIMLDFTKSAHEVSQHIRAFYPWFKTYFEWENCYLSPLPYGLEILENAKETEKIGLRQKLVIKRCGDGKFLKMHVTVG